LKIAIAARAIGINATYTSAASGFEIVGDGRRDGKGRECGSEDEEGELHFDIVQVIGGESLFGSDLRIQSCSEMDLSTVKSSGRQRGNISRFYADP
jgi:hypothetical protein